MVAGKTALVVGPGIGVSDDTKALIEFLVTECSTSQCPLLIDADGLNALAELGCGLIRKAKGPVVLTPHPGEMGRLLSQDTAAINSDRISAARRLCDLTGARCLLKGNRTVIANPTGIIYVNSSGNAGMATAGIGRCPVGNPGNFAGAGGWMRLTRWLWGFFFTAWRRTVWHGIWGVWGFSPRPDKRGACGIGGVGL